MKLSLLGAGPGDAELITMKAVRILGEADVVMYDALANESLLTYVKPEAELIYVGKRKGMHSVSQDEINRIILENVKAGKHVARLKGGDPVVFGRGFEEMEMVEKYGVEVELVPGISSSVAVPCLAGVPVTKRGVSESFWVLTGHTKSSQLPEDMYLAARSNATVIILMGMSKLAEICQVFIDAGKEDLPAAIIQEGSTDRERMVVGEVGTIAEKSKKEGVSNPAVIVFGETVKCSPEYLKSEVNRQINAYV
ncbi:uroporphyrinogen-III C-methyltransferase [Jiulongibacter sp. NS-SX5]|uniref:uroporphyrinogen-III C-methyltransferase n=1 Tax=Jiulongibacter sp. NS-SX5 TaxID=3463854 RepID=UPI00405844EC